MNALSYVPRTVIHWFTDGIFRRIFKNAGLMLSGRATTGLLSLATLSVAAQALGVEQFGVLILVQTYVLVITALTTFQSWQAVIRYGAVCLEGNNTGALQALVKFTSLLDLAGVIVGSLVGYFAAPLVGPYVGWSDEVIAYAQPFSFLILFTIVATPTGLLRLYDRFDLLAIHTVVTPFLRLVGVIIAALFSAPFWAYLVAYFVAGAIGGLLLVYLGWREIHKDGRLRGLDASLNGLTIPHGGIWRFSIYSNLHASLQVITQHMSTFLVGLVAGPAAAGLFKIGRDVATALTKPAELLNQSIYPEFARLSSRGGWDQFAYLILRGGAVAGGAGALLLALAFFFGEPFLGFFFGEAFADSYLPHVLLVAAAVITVTGFPMDPALYAMGRPSIPLRIDMVSILLIFIPVLVLLTRVYGPTGAGIATLVSAAFTFIVMAFFTATQLRLRAVG
ncbi:MAG: oligosaccharide flippase family protein, partial [Rhodospirillaceae bacterium]